MIRWLLLPSLAVAALAAQPPTPSAPANGAAGGQRLRAELLAQQPPENSSVPAVLKIRAGDGERRDIPVRLRTERVDSATWRAIYETTSAGDAAERLVVTRRTGGVNDYALASGGRGAAPLIGTNLFRPFAGSDFSAADLGLEFLHWPTQTLVKSEMRRGRPCKVLVSTAAPGSGGAYARVLSWIDNETGGLLRAEAYDAQGRLVKEFSLRSFKKVNGQWQLREMEIITYPQDSRTRLEFELDLNASRTDPP